MRTYEPGTSGYKYSFHCKSVITLFVQ
jgi:hypothetical protein